MNPRRFLIVLAVIAAPMLVWADPFSVPWWKVSSGGGTSEGGSFTISGIIGQPESGVTSSGGNYSVTTGFWSRVNVIQVDGLPELKILRSAKANVVLTWTEGEAPLTIEESPDAKPGSWSPTARQIVSVGNARQITISGATGRSFFRLKRLP